MRQTPIAVLSLVVAVGIAASCKQSQSDSAPTTSPHGDGAAATTFHDMDHAQRKRFMKEVVLPTMKPLFAAAEPEEFSNMKCVACHGAGAKDDSFEMPNPDLPQLPGPTDAAGWKELGETDAEMVKFMKETVVPQMASMLGEAPYDPATGKGFGCFECHTQKK